MRLKFSEVFQLVSMILSLTFALSGEYDRATYFLVLVILWRIE